MGKFEPATHADFTPVEQKYLASPEEKKMLYWQKPVGEAFQRMATAAAKAGVTLRIVSAARNFEYQKNQIWEQKWKRLAKKYPNPAARAAKILAFSAMPGTSRHHWGTDVDLNSLNNGDFERGKGAKTYRWLCAHAAEYGFFQPYTEKNKLRPDGYNEEKWHWSYAPIADLLTEKCRQLLRNDLLTNFSGSETASELKIVEKYVLINPRNAPSSGRK